MSLTNSWWGQTNQRQNCHGHRVQKVLDHFTQVLQIYPLLSSFDIHKTLFLCSDLHKCILKNKGSVAKYHDVQS